MPFNNFAEDENVPKTQDRREATGSLESPTHYETKNFKNLWFQVIATVITALFHLIAGISFALPRIMLLQIHVKDSSDFQHTVHQEFWIVTVSKITVSVGGIIVAFLIDSIGRLNTIKLSLIPAIVGWVIIILSKRGTVMITGQIISGLAVAWSTCPAIVYITEIARPDIRGSLITITAVFNSLGGILTECEHLAMSWRTIAGVAILCNIVAFVLVMFIPETPVWLISKGRTQEAQKALHWYHRYQSKPKNTNISFAQFQFEYLMKEQEKNGLKKKGCFAAYKPLLILLGLFLFQQLSGAPHIWETSPKIFEGPDSDFFYKYGTLLILCLRCVLSIVNIFLLKLFGRRTLIIFGSACMALFMVAYGLWTCLMEINSPWVFDVILLLLLTCSMISFLSIPWIMIAELFPIEIRGAAYSIVFSLANLLSVALVDFPWLLYALHFFVGVDGITVFFGAMSLTGCVYAYYFLPETRGVKLWDIQKYFKSGNITWVQMKKDLERQTIHQTDEISVNHI